MQRQAIMTHESMSSVTVDARNREITTLGCINPVMKWVSTTFPSTGAKPPDFETINSMKDKSDAILKACTFWFGKVQRCVG